MSPNVTSVILNEVKNLDLSIARITRSAQPPRSKPLRSRTMGLYLKEACIFEWMSVAGGRNASLWPSTDHVNGPYAHVPAPSEACSSVYRV